jgi:hypothetical protein
MLVPAVTSTPTVPTLSQSTLLSTPAAHTAASLSESASVESPSPLVLLSEFCVRLRIIRSIVLGKSWSEPCPLLPLSALLVSAPDAHTAASIFPLVPSRLSARSTRASFPSHGVSLLCVASTQTGSYADNNDYSTTAWA